MGIESENKFDHLQAWDEERVGLGCGGGGGGGVDWCVTS
jgi:hypothetical protein